MNTHQQINKCLVGQPKLMYNKKKTTWVVFFLFLITIKGNLTNNHNVV